MLKVKIKNISGNRNPEYATEGSAGMDLRAFLADPVIIEPGARKLIPTGIFIELPIGYQAEVRPRSGLAVKNGISVLNTPGTIDEDYRGEIKVILINLSGENFTVNNGDRIAQLVITKYEKVEWQNSDEINNSRRGERGFGHSGMD